MAQKVLALENGRDDRIIEIYKSRWQIEILNRYPGFNRMEPLYLMNEGKEKFLFANANREFLYYDFYDEIYEMIEDAFLPILENYEAPNCVYDYDWAKAFITEYERYAPWHNPG